MKEKKYKKKKKICALGLSSKTSKFCLLSKFQSHNLAKFALLHA